MHLIMLFQFIGFSLSTSFRYKKLASHACYPFQLLPTSLLPLNNKSIPAANPPPAFFAKGIIIPVQFLPKCISNCI
jgi:hypothetical protein